MKSYKNFMYLTFFLVIGIFFFFGLKKSNSGHSEIGVFGLNNDEKEKVLNINRIASNSKNKKFENLKILNSEGNYSSLKDIIGETPKIIFRFNENQCSAYIDQHSLSKTSLLSPGCFMRYF